jgi:putative membrane protein
MDAHFFVKEFVMQLRHLRLATAIIGTMAISTGAYAATLSTKDFVKKASYSNQFEIQSSQNALDKSHNDAIQKFAQRMIDDHTEAAGNMVTAIDASRLQVQPEDDVDVKHHVLLGKLDVESGATFDRDYIQMQVKAHKEAVALFSDYAANGKDPALKQFAQNTLPTLKSHLKHVQQLAAQ